jgi:hypothetical protein
MHMGIKGSNNEPQGTKKLALQMFTCLKSRGVQEIGN